MRAASFSKTLISIIYFSAFHREISNKDALKFARSDPIVLHFFCNVKMLLRAPIFHIDEDFEMNFQ
jgi:hypothetical protein